MNDIETMTKGFNTLNHWSWLSEATLVNDSKIDLFTTDDLFNNTKCMQNTALIMFMSDGDVFGVFYNIAVIEQHRLQRPEWV